MPQNPKEMFTEHIIDKRCYRKDLYENHMKKSKRKENLKQQLQEDTNMHYRKGITHKLMKRY